MRCETARTTPLYKWFKTSLEREEKHIGENIKRREEFTPSDPIRGRELVPPLVSPFSPEDSPPSRGLPLMLSLYIGHTPPGSTVYIHSIKTPMPG